MQPSRILIADDDRSLCRLLADFLQREGFVVETANDGDAALARLQAPAERPDLVILDVMMPGRDGLATLRELRRLHHLPVIMLSARGEPVDRVVGLELGADDYLAKPCLPRELLARVRAQLRRASPQTAEPLRVGPLELLPAEHRARVAGHELTLTGAEFMLLLGLAQRPGQVLDRETLTRLALGRELERFDRSIDVHVSHVRRKLNEASARAPRIDAVRGSGYVLVVAEP
ncbi:MAG TPA: response regulator transcription factor [Rhodanobacteraceae bacterium]|nr:response regulator transcription factor [Rhodanobacteraceae bacterium]